MLCNAVDLEEPDRSLVQEPSKDLPENRPTHCMWTEHSVWLWASHKRLLQALVDLNRYFGDDGQFGAAAPGIGLEVGSGFEVALAYWLPMECEEFHLLVDIAVGQVVP